MSTIKNPEEKKRLSLAHDRRNTYGENSKSSRKNIRLGKQRTNMNQRRSADEALRHLKGNVPEDDAVDAEHLARTRIIDSKRRGFKKVPDTPLGVVVMKKKTKS
jgi:hypothetical protein